MENKKKKSNRFESQESYMLSASETAKKVAFQRKVNAVLNYYGFYSSFKGFQYPEDIEVAFCEHKTHLFYLNECNCPLSIANAFITAKNSLYEDNTPFGIIAFNLSKTTIESFNRWGDRNHINKDIKRNYISQEGIPIDSQAEEMTNQFNILICESDIVDFITCHPKGREEYKKFVICNELSDKFKELVGFTLTLTFARELLKMTAEKLEENIECPF